MSARNVMDSRGRTHYLLHQELSKSCGPACVAMAESFYTMSCMVDPEGKARQLSQLYPGKFTVAGGTSDMMNLAWVLNAENVPTYGATAVGPAKIFDYCWYYIGERTKVIVHIKWSSGGGHFALLKQIDADHRMIFLDPWYDIVEVPRASLPNYTIGGASGTLSSFLVITHR